MKRFDIMLCCVDCHVVEEISIAASNIGFRSLEEFTRQELRQRAEHEARGPLQVVGHSRCNR